MTENTPIQQTEPNIYSLTNAEIIATDEEFFLHLHSGNSIRRYHLTPNHMKRIALLAGKEVAKYEEGHGELKTSLVANKKKRLGNRPQIGFRSK